MAPVKLLRVGDLVEALDLEGQWYPARVVQQASEGLSASARIRPHRGWGTERMPDDWQIGSVVEALDLEGKWCASKDEGGRGDNSEDVCALCEEVGRLVCCDGPCRRSFHIECVPLNNPPPHDERAKWRCADCLARRYRCFGCKKWAARDELQQCAVHA
ncbi:hypothetical protein EMIHUDRAFT_194217 [Emiliania huxleyi CCMP1516]|uniref:PHD-type domain-containing protein n=2 Tax=Emiliania huxleyi TaxID=2903 RepID=A0A0D3L151_EMIH1|nr:hypothetical protein EMIHUDRAFT_194217 [Emiliania huxleyi CCMP1516]EOD41736.1 hypothetical protein EMIHUDRAFT_194217 [Emiliania huxleyi CCMP1516]|eukprot:XP_005794165.1 hypothetical protein EMIHUDRAFT_194217 [Emiliania huxleyi CCMP1516]